MATLHQLTLLLLLHHLLLATVVVALLMDGQALLSFKSTMWCDPNGVLSNRNASNMDPCVWNGVSYFSTSLDEARRVVMLSLPQKHLIASLSSLVGLLSSHCHLNLRDSYLFGPVSS
ncbi:hypothetical protein PR202_gb25912 [Eleusine coracana subsp. coracana]|uniref:Leucine-rich repeat-containing N-terminal plant-type domain-containing protein n=1 Tax=Eleusine coracana subsp. coracana TaxID=191504 RepID=A0AAV5FR95_ELECO|nr:hypothetical protein PR202_gb25912 [Eleusine coracana subsp. coracana]